MADMTPEQARAELESSLHTRTPEYVFACADRALAALAAMRVEEDWRIVDPFTNGGKYETRRHTRHVTDWSAE